MLDARAVDCGKGLEQRRWEVRAPRVQELLGRFAEGCLKHGAALLERQVRLAALLRHGGHTGASCEKADHLVHDGAKQGNRAG